MRKTAAAAFALLLLVLSCGACRSAKKNPPPTEPAQEEESASSEFVPAVRPATDPPEDEAFDFDQEAADYIGYFESPIYGRLLVYYQEEKLVILNAYGTRLFLLSAQSFDPKNSEDPPELIAEDMNFDGAVDFGVLYQDDGMNRYYDCWLWNHEERTFQFSVPLSGIPSPTFDAVNQTVYSYYRLTAQNAIVAEYKWQSAGLVPVAHHASNGGSENILNAPEDVDTPISIFDGIQFAGVTLRGNVDSQSRWLLKIEDETMVRLYANEYNPVNAMYKFTFQGLRPGTTTVALKYAVSWDAPAIADKALNITVLPDFTLRIVETER